MSGHEHHMHAALEQGRLASAEGNLPIGSVIVHDDVIVAVGRNGIDSQKNDTLHAELSAIQSIPRFLFAHKRECTIYSTLEPCMMCLGAIISVGISKIVFGVADGYVGAMCLLPHGKYYEVKSRPFQVTGGVLAAESQSMLNEYVRRTGFRAHHSTELD